MFTLKARLLDFCFLMHVKSFFRIHRSKFLCVFINMIKKNSWFRNVPSTRASSSLGEKLWARCQNIKVDVFWPYVGHSEVTDCITELDLIWTLVLFLFFAIAKHKCQNHHLGSTAGVRKSRRLHCLSLSYWQTYFWNADGKFKLQFAKKFQTAFSQKSVSVPHRRKSFCYETHN